MVKNGDGSDMFVSKHPVEVLPDRIGVRQAVLIRNATKSYGTGKKRCTVLEGLNMTVNKGSM
jgi:hypothetical protein